MWTARVETPTAAPADCVIHQSNFSNCHSYCSQDIIVFDVLYSDPCMGVENLMPFVNS